MISTADLVRELAAALDAPEKLVAHYAKRLRSGGALPSGVEPALRIHALTLLMTVVAGGPAHSAIDHARAFAMLPFAGLQGFNDIVTGRPFWSDSGAGHLPESAKGAFGPSLNAMVDAAAGAASSFRPAHVTIGDNGLSRFATIGVSWARKDAEDAEGYLLFGQHPFAGLAIGRRIVRSAQFGAGVLARLHQLFPGTDAQPSEGLTRAARRGPAFWHGAPPMIS